MKYIFFIICFLILEVSCNSSTCAVDNPNIILDYFPYRVDLNSKQYTVFNSQDSLVINFSLSDNEQREIMEMYCASGIQTLPDSLIFEDECKNYPQLSTIIYIQDDRKRTYEINMNCKGKYLDKYNSSKVYQFIEFLFEILKKKKEIRDTPISDAIII